MATSRRHTSQRLTLVILIVASLTAITLDYRGPASHALGSIRNAARDALSPVQHVLQDVFRPVGDFFAGAVNYSALANENARLRTEVGTLRREALENAGAEQQLQQLLSLEKLPFLANSKEVLADVISGPSSNFALTFEIDRGTAEGVGSGMPVVSGAGLVGTVVSAGSTTAVVRLLTDPGSAIGVRFPDGTTALANGQGRGNLLSVTEIPSGAPIASRGESLVTSGLEPATYPAGIPVGTVARVRRGNGALSESVSLRPVADLSDLEYVAVVQWLPAA